MCNVRTAAFTLGLIGGIIGLFAGLLEMTTGGLAGALVDESGSPVVIMGVFTLLISAVAIVGGSVARGPNTTAAGILLISMSILGFFSAGLFWIPSGLLLVVAGACAFGARDTPTIN